MHAKILDYILKETIILLKIQSYYVKKPDHQRSIREARTQSNNRKYSQTPIMTRVIYTIIAPEKNDSDRAKKDCEPISKFPLLMRRPLDAIQSPRNMNKSGFTLLRAYCCYQHY